MSHGEESITVSLQSEPAMSDAGTSAASGPEVCGVHTTGSPVSNPNRCIYCDQPVNADGSIYHYSRCDGIKPAGLNRLQYDKLMSQVKDLGDALAAARGHLDALRDSYYAARAEVMQLRSLLVAIRGYMVPGNVMPVPEQAKFIVQWIDNALARFPDDVMNPPTARDLDNSIPRTTGVCATQEPQNSGPNGEERGSEFLREKNGQLRTALDRLRIEVQGCLTAFEHEMREAIGNTNYEVLSLRWREANAVLVPSASRESE